MLEPLSNDLPSPASKTYNSNSLSIKVVKALSPSLDTVITLSTLMVPSIVLRMVNRHVEALCWECSVGRNAELNLFLHPMKLLEKFDGPFGQDSFLGEGKPIRIWPWQCWCRCSRIIIEGWRVDLDDTICELNCTNLCFGNQRDSIPFPVVNAREENSSSCAAWASTTAPSVTGFESQRRLLLALTVRVSRSILRLDTFLKYIMTFLRSGLQLELAWMYGE